MRGESLRSSLSLNGLRYENYIPQVAAKPGSAGTFDPSTGEVVVAGFGNVPRDMGIHAYNVGFAPRIGIAYQAVHPRLAGHGPTLFAGLSKCVDLRLVSRLEFGSGAVAMRYEPRR